MSTDGFVVLQLTPSERLIGSSNVYADYTSARDRASVLQEESTASVRFRVAAVEIVPDANPAQLAAGRRWAAGYDRRHPTPRTEHDRWAAFDAAEASDENERNRR